MYTILDSRILDVNAEAAGVGMENLMDRAGEAVARLVKSLKKRRILVACGGGNNGGDGYTAASILLRDGFSVECLRASPPDSELSRKKYQAFVKNNGKIVNKFDDGKYDVVVDALLGVGISGIPREPYFTLISQLNKTKATIVSVDVPSGFPSEHSVVPQYTVTMQLQKDGMSKRNSGKITVADVGFTRESIEMIGPGDMLAFPSASSSSHKGDNGVCVMVGGSRTYFGAPTYMAQSALRMGPDLVDLFAPSSIHGYIASNCEGAILKKSGLDYIEFNYEMMKLISEKADSVAIGPGISKNEIALSEASKIIQYALGEEKHVVIDADALESARSIDDFKGMAVLTPHRGEFKSTFELDPDEENVMKVARKINATILVKGEVDVVTDGETLKKNRVYHHRSMTRGGTGDLITGAVAGLLSRKVDPLHSAFLASFIIGKAGLTAFNRFGDGYLVSDLLNMVPEILVTKGK